MNNEIAAQFDSFFKPDRIAIVGVLDKASNRTNLITIGFITYMGIGDGQVIAFPVHPNRHSHNLFKQENYFVVNLLNVDQYKIAHVCGTKSGRNTDKYEEAKIKPIDVPNYDGNLKAINEATYFMLAEKTEVRKIAGCTHDMVVGRPVSYFKGGSEATKPLWHVSDADYFQFMEKYGGKGYKGGYGGPK